MPTVEFGAHHICMLEYYAAMNRTKVLKYSIEGGKLKNRGRGRQKKNRKHEIP